MRSKLFIILTTLFIGLNVFAQSGKSLDLDGVNRYMQIPHHADFNFSTTEDYTISFWINVNAYVTNARMVAKREGGTPADKSGYEIWGTNSSANFFALNTPNAAGVNTFSAWGTIPGGTGNWIHIAMVVSGSGTGRVVYQYQGGQVAKSSAGRDMSSYGVTNTRDIFVGKSEYAGGFLNAKIDNLRFYKRALSQAEIQADMTAAVTASTPNLVAAYDFETVTGATVTDITGNHNGTLVNFPTPGNITITGATVTKDNNYTGRGNDREEIVKAVLTTTGNTPTNINNLKFNMTGTTDISEVEEIKIYTTGSNEKFDTRVATGKTLIATVTPTSGDINVATTGQIVGGKNVLWITYKIKETAKEGNKVGASLLSITTDNETYTVPAATTEATREILLRRKLVFAPGDYGSVSYRIPAICTAADGSLVTLVDKRKNHSGDLPADIDILCKRSTDGGKTWSEPIMVAQGSSAAGYGDAAVVKANSGKLVALFVGNAGLWGSTPTNPMRTYMATSTDNGLTWSAKTDITPQIYGAECTDPVRSKWLGLFFGSGHMLCTRAGRLMAVVAVREPGVNGLNNYAVYSDDEGTTWKVSNKAITGGDEAKVVELNNGDILMSSRATGNRLWAKSTDGGINWGGKKSWPEICCSATDADIIRYTSKIDGYDKNRLLHTLPNAGDRRNVTIWISYDEGETWPVKRSISPNTSAYSSITILADGTIGAYFESNYNNGVDTDCNMHFENFSLDWLSNGADSYTAPGTEIVGNPTSSLAEGNYANAQTITLTSTTPDAKIYYTLDGSAPNKNSTLYTGAITLNNSCVLKALAVKEGLANSNVMSFVYRIGQYLVNTNPGEVLTRTDRHIDVLKFTGNMGGNFTGTIPAEISKNVYNDLTSTTTAYAVPGETLTPSIAYTGNWMHGYLYLDYGNNGVFTYNINSDGTPATGSDIVSYSAHDIDYTTAENWKNSLGASASKNSVSSNSIAMPAFTIPSTTEPGIYRMRYKVDWDNIDAGGNTSLDNRITANGGGMVDVLLNIHKPNITVTAVSTDGTVNNASNTLINNTSATFAQPLTIKLVPNSGRKLSTLNIKHGYISKDEIIYSNRQWKTENISLDNVVDNQYTIPAEFVDGDVEITAFFSISSNVVDVNQSAALSLSVKKNSVSVSTLKPTDVLISDIAGRTFFSGKITGEKCFSLNSGVYFINKSKVIVP